MSGKFLLIIFGVIMGITTSVAQAGTRIDSPLEIVKIDDPASEKKCLEAFVNSEFLQAFSICLPLAQNGMRDAQLVTGLMYVFGDGTEKNTELAELWLKEAVRNGSLEAKQVLSEFGMAE